MPFLTSGAFTTFTANTKAKSAEVNANFAAFRNFLNTITGDALVGSVWQNIAATSASHTLTASDSIRTLLVNPNTTGSLTVTLPTAAASAYRRITVRNTSQTIGSLVIDGAGSETIDNTLTTILPARSSVTLHCDGSAWHSVDRYSDREIVAFKSSINYTVTDGDRIRTLLVEASGADRTITLPTGAGSYSRILTIVKTDAVGNGSVIISTLSGGNWTLTHKGDYVTVQLEPAGSWQVIEGQQRGALAKSADYTVGNQDGVRTVLMTTGGTNRTVTLPAAANNESRILTVKKVDSGSGSVTVDGASAETVDGATTFVLYKQYEAVTVQCDGTSWHILDKVDSSTPTVFKFTSWNPSGSGAVTTDASAGTEESARGDVTTSSVSSGTVTFTFNRAGKWLVNVNLGHSHSASYTVSRFLVTTGGTATRYGETPTNSGTVRAAGVSAEDTDTYESFSFVVSATAAQTLTIRPRADSDGLGGAGATTANFHASVILTPL